MAGEPDPVGYYTHAKTGVVSETEIETILLGWYAEWDPLPARQSDDAEVVPAPWER